MTKAASMRVSLGLFVTAALLVSSGVVGAGAATGPKLKVTPSTNLKNGETVRVSGTGFQKGDTVYVVECLVSAKGGGQCNELGATPATVTSSGTLPITKFKVITGKIGGGTCGTTAANLKKCAISVGDAEGKDTASFPIVFK
jgi:hypothetical protein